MNIGSYWRALVASAGMAATVACAPLEPRYDVFVEVENAKTAFAEGSWLLDECGWVRPRQAADWCREGRGLVRACGQFRKGVRALTNAHAAMEVHPEFMNAQGVREYLGLAIDEYDAAAKWCNSAANRLFERFVYAEVRNALTESAARMNAGAALLAKGAALAGDGG